MALETATLDDGTAYEDADLDALDGETRRAVRARTQNMVVLPQTDPDGNCIGMYDVSSESGSHNVVVLDERKACTCEDTQWNDPENCKHRRRVSIQITETALPAPGQPVGEYADELAAIRQRFARQRAALLEELSTLNSLIDPLDGTASA